MAEPSFATPPGLAGNAEPNASKIQTVRMVATSLSSRLQAQRLPTFVRSFRTSGDTSLYDPSISRNRPIQFDIGSFAVPQTQTVLLTNFVLKIATFSGVAGGDVEYMDPGSLSTRMGFSFKVNSQQPQINGALALAPVPLLADTEGIVSTGSGRNPTTTVFTRASAKAYGMASASGQFLIPYNGIALADPIGPFTLVANQGQVVSMGVFCFSSLVRPVAFFEAAFQGTIVPTRLAQQLSDLINV